MWADEDGWICYVATMGGTHEPESRMAEVEALVESFELTQEFETGGTEASQSFEL